MDIAKKALAMAQLNLQVIAHNVANANTPGYSRQRAELMTSPPLSYPSLSRGGFPQQLGAGVDVEAVRRIRDEFLDEIIRKQTGTQGYNKTVETALSQIELIYNEPGENTLSALIDKFFAAWLDLANNPELVSARANLREQAVSMVREFSRIDDSLKRLGQEQISQIYLKVEEANNLASQIADLNIQIGQVKGLGDNPNDLMDRQDELVEKLADIVPISTIDQSDGTVSVLIGGLRIVEQDRAQRLVVKSGNDPARDIEIEFSNHMKPNLDGSGILAGLIETFQDTVPHFLSKLDNLATSIINRVNYHHLDGFGLDGMKGRSFFNDLRTAEMAGTVTFATSVTEDTPIDQLGITAGNFEIMGTEIIIQPDDVTPAQAITLGELLDRINLAQPWVRAVLVEESGGSKRIRLDLFNPVEKDAEITIFRGSSSFLTISGLENTQTNFLESNELYSNSADMMEVYLAIIDNLDYIAAAGDDGSGIFPGPGNNENAITIASLQSISNALFETTYGDYYSSTIAELGSVKQSISRLVTNQDVLLSQLNVRRESVRGVNMDEEAAAMIVFQRIYEGAARVIQVIDTMLDTVINRLGA